MDQSTSFDLLVVYSQSLAKSASDSSVNNITPFAANSRNQSYNEVYGYFLEVCNRLKLTAAFTTSADIVGPGQCQSYWQYQYNQWSKVNLPCSSSLIFDKFSPTSLGVKLSRQLLFSQEKIKPFNNPILYDLFFDKQKTYDQLSDYAIPTVSIKEKTLTGLITACKELSNLISRHPTPADFSCEIVMKDRFGAGGRRVYKFSPGQLPAMLAVISKKARISYIIQPLVKFDRGFSYQNHPASTDIRLIYLQGQIIQSYIRVAKAGDFRCNEHQGGLLTYVSLDQIPSTLVSKSNIIAQTLDNQHSLFSLDFIISNNGNSYLLEGNTGPGLDWNIALVKNEVAAKKLIRLIVNELILRAKADNCQPPQKTIPFVPDLSPVKYIANKIGRYRPSAIS